MNIRVTGRTSPLELYNAIRSINDLFAAQVATYPDGTPVLAHGGGWTAIVRSGAAPQMIGSLESHGLTAVRMHGH